MALPPDVCVRRVRFREGTDDELTALHRVEVPIEMERGSDRMPRPLASYMAFARDLPARFDDHAWLVETVGGDPLAAGYCWSNSAGDSRVMECDVLVGRERRRQGIGSQMLAEIVRTTAAEGRSWLTWSSFASVPAGDAFSRRVGARAARVNRTSELRLDALDWAMVDRWADAPGPRDLGYRLELIDGPFPARLRADAVRFHHIMQTAPKEDLDIGDVLIDTEDVAELDKALVESGRLRWTLLVRDPAGCCVGGTEVTYEPWEPSVIRQQNTGIAPAHRGLGLAKWAKAAMLQRLRAERPQAEVVCTDNAGSNAPMLAINDALGFVVTSTRTEWQAGVEAVRHALDVESR